MAEVEKLATATISKDIPISGSGVAEVVSNDASISAEFGTSPTQERSSNSHPHDSEYDTASDLEGGEEYDESEDGDLEDDEEDDLSDEDDDDIDNDDNDEEEVPSGLDVGAGSQEKVSEAEIQKKVDEDRSNPQYIPKRGTFYEHDDRMADGEGECVLAIGDPENADGTVTGNVGNTKAILQTPSISHASTTKKWQPASGVERWSHDRFEEIEQQPKSRSELISSYGYDIRTEDAPPRARRRRRYARGPTKYSRNWEDESAYIKMNNKERKPLRASDFPALNERSTRKPRREPRERDENIRDEKENRPERQRPPMNKSSVNERLNIAAGRSNQNEEPREREDIRARISGRPKVQGRQSNVSGRQAAMEFKPRSRNSKQQQQQSNNTHNNSRSDDRGYDRPRQQRGGGGVGSGQYQPGSSHQNNSLNEQYQQKSFMKGNQSMSASNAAHIKQTQHHQHHHQQQHQQQFHGDSYGNNNNHQTNKFNEQHGGYSQQQQSTMQHHSQQQQGLTQLRQPLPLKSTPPPSNLSQRLQQVQNRNDPSHVGSVQMHSLATQNQQQQQLVIGQQQNPNAMLMSAVTQQQQQIMQAQPQEQRGPPKRYSSMRRSQHDQQHIVEPHTTHQPQQQMQQMHMQQQQPPPQQAAQAPQPPPPQQLLMQDQHSLMQANLLQQLYHQENLQAQMQALQVSQPPPPAQQVKPPTYAAVPPPTTAPPAQQAYGGNPANAAYYVTDAYGSAAAPNPQAAPPSTQYAQQQPAYLAPAPAAAAAALGYTNPPPQPQASLPSGPPTTVYSGPGGTGPGPAAPNSNQNFSNYQNYNTVGGTTYFVPPAPTTSRPVVLPQRRPTNAIPILPPAEKNRQRGNETFSKEDLSRSLSNNGSNTVAPIGSAENIDHIIDNMFVQRPVFQPLPTAVAVAATTTNPIPAARQSSSPSNSDSVSVSSNTGNDTQTQAQISNVDDTLNAANNTLGASSAEASNKSSTPVINDEISPAANNVNLTESSNNNNTVTSQE